MASLTIRNLDDLLKRRLRLRAAENNRSMEEEARQILWAALQEPAGRTTDLGARIRARFAGLGDVQLSIDAREPVRALPQLGESAGATAPRKRQTGMAGRKRG